MRPFLVGLGANLGDREASLASALRGLAALPDTRLEAVSRLYETAPVGGPEDAGPYLNACVRGRTALTPRDLLDGLLAIERRAGRVRTRRNAPRTLDLDLLLHDREVLVTPGLVLPHPRLSLRAFALVPAAEIAGAMIHPVTGLTLERHLGVLGSTAGVAPFAGAAWPPPLDPR